MGAVACVHLHTIFRARENISMYIDTETIGKSRMNPGKAATIFNSPAIHDVKSCNMIVCFRVQLRERTRYIKTLFSPGNPKAIWEDRFIGEDCQFAGDRIKTKDIVVPQF